MSILDDVKRAQKGALPLLKLLTDSSPVDFEKDLDDYARSDGIIDRDFLANLETVKSHIAALLKDDKWKFFLDIPMEFQMALLELLVKEGKHALLPKIASEIKEKKFKKLIKRRIHQLKSEGVVIKDEKKKSGFKFRKLIEPHPDSMISETNRLGEREIFFSALTPGMGVRLLYVLTNFFEGVTSFRVFDTSRSGFKEIINKLKTDNDLEIYKAPMPIGHFFIKEAIKINEQSEKPFPTGFISAFTSMPEPEKMLDVHPVWDLISKDHVEKSFSVFMKSDALHHEPDFRNWTLPIDTLRKIESKFSDIFQDKILLSGEEKEDQIDRMVVNIINEYFDKDNREIWRKRIENGAYFLALNGKTEMAVMALATAKALSRQERLAGGIPFCKELLSKLINIPDGAQDQTAKKPADEDESGLILP